MALLRSAWAGALVPGSQNPLQQACGEGGEAERRQGEIGHHARALRAADGAVELHRLFHRLRAQADRARHLVIGPVMGEFLPGEALADDVQRFREPAPRLRHGDAVSIVFGFRRAAPEAQMQRAPRQRVQHRDLLGDAHRVVPGQHQHRGAEPDIRAERRHMRHEEQRARRRVVVREMVLQHPDRFVAERLGELHVLDDFVVKHLVGLADIGGGRGLHAEGHGSDRRHGNDFLLRGVSGAAGGG